MFITLIGRGMGDRNSLTLGALEAIEKAEIIFGPKRMLLDFPDKRSYACYLAEDILPILEKEMPEQAVVLFSGDSGYFSGASKMCQALKKWKEEKNFAVDYAILPGISSFSYLSARLGIPYTDAFLYSLHGKKEDPKALGEVKKAIETRKAAFLLLSGAGDVRKIGELMEETGDEGQMKLYLGKSLSYEEEEILQLNAKAAKSFEEEGLYTACILNETPKKALLLPNRKDEDFYRDKVPMTKELIRHESIIALGLREDDVVYDIGCGSGSVAVEIAGLSPSLKVFAFERKQEAILLTKKNIEKFFLRNISVIEGDALESLEEKKELLAPDAVFIGGSGGKLIEILKQLPRKCDDSGKVCPIRVVVNAVSLETIAELSRLEKELMPKDFSVRQISVANAKSLGEYHLLQAENPVMICSFTV